MMAYSGGDSFPCVVAEVGSYATKMGFAGEDYPRSYFRSSTAILRDQDPAQKGKIIDRSYDFTTRPLAGGGSSSVDDGNWELCNPIENSTGLVCEGLPPSTGTTSTTTNTTTKSHNSNNSNNDDDDTAKDSNNNTTTNNSTNTPAGECFSHFSSYLTHGYHSALGMTDESSNTPLLLIERSYNPPPIRQKTLEILFEQQNVPATFLARDAVCACYAVGRTTGTVVDVGYGGTVVSPVYEGFVETKGVLRSPVGGAMMEDSILGHLDSLYRKRRARARGGASSEGGGAGGGTGGVGGVDYALPLYQTRVTNNIPRREPFHRFARLDMARLSKEDGSAAGVAAYGYASLDASTAAAAAAGGGTSDAASTQSDDPNDIYQQYANAPKIPYKLPDGTVIDIPQTKRFDVAELLFGKDTMSTQKRDDAVHKMGKRLNSIILSGGGGAGGESSSDSKSPTQFKKRGGGTIGQKTDRVGRVRNQPISYVAHQNLLHACIPYLSSSIGELTSSTIPGMVCDSAFKCDRDQQAQLLGNVVLCGGGACLSKTAVLSSSSADYQYGNAMTERVREEVEAIVHTHTPGWRVKVLSPGPTERAVCSWLGGSILGSLGSFHEMWITKKEYEEHGAAIVNRKCP